MRSAHLLMLCTIACTRPSQVPPSSPSPSAPCPTAVTCDAACTEGRAAACYRLASLDAAGDTPGRRRHYERACELGDSRGCARRALLEQVGPKADTSAAQAWFSRALDGVTAACAAADEDGCEVLAMMHHAGKAPAAADAGPRAIELYEQRCARGDGEACLREGVLLDTAQLVPADPARALARLLRACDLGLAGGCAAAGLKFLRGDGVAADGARSTELLRRAKALMPSPDAG